MNILILSVTSDIGLYLAKKYHAEGIRYMKHIDQGLILKE